MRHQQVADAEIQARIAQYEMAFRMQTSVPDLLDIESESQSVLDMYGPDVRRPGSYAANCLLARRLAYRYQGRDFRLTDIHGAVVKEVLA